MLFQINDHVEMLLHKPKIKDLPYIFLVGGFAESSRLQKSMRDAFGDRLTILVSDYINCACGYHPVSLDYSSTLWSVCQLISHFRLFTYILVCACQSISHFELFTYFLVCVSVD